MKPSPVTQGRGRGGGTIRNEKVSDGNASALKQNVMQNDTVPHCIILRGDLLCHRRQRKYLISTYIWVQCREQSTSANQCDAAPEAFAPQLNTVKQLESKGNVLQNFSARNNIAR